MEAVEVAAAAVPQTDLEVLQGHTEMTGAMLSTLGANQVAVVVAALVVQERMLWE